MYHLYLSQFAEVFANKSVSNDQIAGTCKYGDHAQFFVHVITYIV